MNCAYVRLAPAVGLENVEQAAHDLGITSDLKVHDCNCLTPAMSLGGLDVGVSPLEMASAYATLAADGVYHKPYFIEKVLDRHGKVLFRGGGKGEQRVSACRSRDRPCPILKSVVTERHRHPGQPRASGRCSARPAPRRTTPTPGSSARPGN